MSTEMEMVRRFILSAFGAFSAASIVYFFVKFSLTHWKKRGIVHEVPEFLWGNVKGVGSRRHFAHALQEVYEKHKKTNAPFVGFYVLISPMVMMLKLDAIKRILDEDFEYFTERGLFSWTVTNSLDCNLMHLDGEDWRRLRPTLEPAFERQNLAKMCLKMFRVAKAFRETLLELQVHGSVLNISEHVERYNAGVIGSLAFGVDDISTLRDAQSEFRQMCLRRPCDAGLLREYLMSFYPTLAWLLRCRSVDPSTANYFLKTAQSTVDERRESRTRENDFLQLLIDLEPVPGREYGLLQKKQIAAQAYSFVHHGLETLNATLVFCLYELALQPTLQSKVRGEIKKVLANHKGTLSFKSLREMQYADQVLSETLRLHPPYTFLLRKATQDYEMPNSVFMLKEGNRIIIPVAAIHHDPLIYPNPTKFDPDRFNPELVKQRHPMSWLPFGYGRRSCVALQFAKMQALVALVTLLHDFEFSPCADTTIEINYDFKRVLLRPKSDIYLKVDRI